MYLLIFISGYLRASVCYDKKGAVLYSRQPLFISVIYCVPGKNVRIDLYFLDLTYSSFSPISTLLVISRLELPTITLLDAPEVVRMRA